MELLAEAAPVEALAAEAALVAVSAAAALVAAVPVEAGKFSAQVLVGCGQYS